MSDTLFLILGFVTLFMSGKYLVVGSVQLAKLFKIPTLIVGLTIVSFGTSAPELIISLKAALSGHPDIAIGNVVGSNISNIALVLGITAIIFPIPVASKLLKFDWPIMMGLSILLFIFGLSGFLTWWNGLFLILAIIIYNVISVIKGRQNSETEEYNSVVPWYWSVLIIAASSVGLIFGADWLVNGASGLARNFGISERIISVSIIAFGTSVPELSTSVIAAFKKETDISIGNIIGSNIFNIAAILGITSLVAPISVNKVILWSDMLWMLGISLLLLLLMLGKTGRLKRWSGVVLILSYSLYIYFLLK
ncbi:MAG: calcium/sodium antiporter [Salinivirgaceae bacterium]|nr:calcium/sodium antiporter [Salinivirgaceae bacterium]